MVETIHLNWEDAEADTQIIHNFASCEICGNYKVNVKTNCGHYFHFKCLLDWRNSHGGVCYSC